MGKDLPHDPRGTFATFLSGLPSSELRALAEEARTFCLPSRDLHGGVSETAVQFPPHMRHAFLSEYLRPVPKFNNGMDLLTVMVRCVGLYHPSLPLRLRSPIEFDSPDLEDCKALRRFSRSYSIAPLLDHALLGQFVDIVRGARERPILESTMADMALRQSIALKAWDAATGENLWFDGLQYPGIKMLAGVDNRVPAV